MLFLHHSLNNNAMSMNGKYCIYLMWKGSEIENEKFKDTIEGNI